MPSLRLRFEHSWSPARVIAAAGLVVVLGAVAVAVDVVVHYLPAVQAIQQGRDLAVAAEADVKASLTHGDTSQFASASSQLATANADFTTRSSVLDDGLLAFVASHLPWIGDQVQGLQAMRHAGAYGSKLGLDLLPVVQPLVPTGAAPSAGGGVLARLWQVASTHLHQLADAEDDLNGLDASLAQIPATSLVGPLDHIRSVLLTKGMALSSTAHVALNLLSNAPSALGAQERRYLILISNPAEERPGGGFIGAVGEVDVQNGHVLAESFEDSQTIDKHVPPQPAPQPLDEYLFHGVPWDLSDANWSADYPTAAATVSRMYAEATGTHVDGVIAVDPVALSYILAVTGPVTVPPYPQQISATNTLLDLNYIINRARPGDPGQAYVPPLGKLLLDKMLSPAASQVSGLVSALGRGVAEKHIVMMFTDPTLENLVTGINAGGQIEDPPQDTLLIADANLSGGKEDLFVTRKFALTASVGSNGDVSDKLVLTYHNPVPTTAADRNLVPSLGGDYNDYLQVFVPSSATLNSLELTANGKTESEWPESTTSDGGLTTFGYLLYVPEGQTVSLEFDYNGPFAASGAAYQLNWSKQVNALTWPIAVDVQLPGQPDKHFASDLRIDRQFNAP